MFRAFLVTVSVGGLAVAAPVPKAPPAPAPKTPANFTLGTAIVEDTPGGAGKMLKFSYPRSTLVSGVNPPPAALRPLTLNMQLAAVKVTTADGKELTGDDLEKALSSAVPAVRSTAVTFDAEWRKLFADDVVFIETVRVGVNPGGAIAPVAPGGVIRPLPIRRGAVVDPPAEEKKEEPKKEELKKEEKK